MSKKVYLTGIITGVIMGILPALSAYWILISVMENGGTTLTVAAITVVIGALVGAVVAFVINRLKQ